MASLPNSPSPSSEPSKASVIVRAPPSPFLSPCSACTPTVEEWRHIICIALLCPCCLLNASAIVRCSYQCRWHHVEQLFQKSLPLQIPLEVRHQALLASVVLVEVTMQPNQVMMFSIQAVVLCSMRRICNPKQTMSLATPGSRPPSPFFLAGLQGP